MFFLNLLNHHFIRDAIIRLKDAIDFWNKDDSLSFCINLGDIIDGNIDDEKTIKDFDKVLETIKPLKHEFYHVIGNHCLQHPGRKDFIVEKLNHNKAPYFVAKKISGYWIIILDGTEISAKYSPPGSEEHNYALKWLEDHPLEQYPNAYNWNSAISNKQLTWLSQQLDEVRKLNEKALIFCHYPVKEESAFKTHLLWNHHEVVDLLNQYNDVVVGYFNGHYHRGGFFHDKNSKIGYVTVEAIVEAPNNSFGRVEVYEDGIKIIGEHSMVSKMW